MRASGPTGATWRLALAVVMAAAGVERVGAAPPAAPSGRLFGAAQHVSYGSADLRVDAAPEPSPGASAGGGATVLTSTGLSGALVITPTFDSSITGDANAAAIEATINSAIGIYEAEFNDPITVSILFRYATTLPNGNPMPSGALAVSTATLYVIPWNTYVASLVADATTTNDATANAGLPGSPLSTDIIPSSADGRAIGLATPPAMFADGSVGVGGPYDGIVTVNSAEPFRFTRPPAAGLFDALRATEHEMDEVLGLGSGINALADLRPQDLFSWSAAGVRNLTASGSRYFSIDGGTTNIVGFNQNPNGDFGDWLSGGCPQANPYVQNAFSCANQASDVSQFSPEGINLDVVGYDLITGSTTTTTSVPTPTTTSTTLPPPVTCGASPIGGCLSPAAATFQVNEKVVGREKLAVVLKKLTAPTVPGTFGNPASGTTSYAVCVYDQANTLRAEMQVNRAGQLCGTKACWSATSTGYKYADKNLSADGIGKITGKSGLATKGLVQASGQNNAAKGHTALPTGVAAALQNNTQATVQILTSDASCFGATFTHIKEGDGIKFKAAVP